jgi:hypothetical protein
LGEPAERRHFGRRETSIHGTALIPGRPNAPCLLRNISIGGAQLEFLSEVWLPFTFELVVESRGIRVWCEVRHQRGTTFGVMFVTEKPGEQAVVPAFASERVRARQRALPAQPTAPSLSDAGVSSLRARILKSKAK